MAFYIVVRHPAAPQTYANDWDPARPWALRTFMTPKHVADKAVGMGTIFVHRCGHGSEPPAIVCEARVLSTERFGREAMVSLQPIRPVSAPPPVTPGPGTNCYTAAAPD